MKVKIKDEIWLKHKFVDYIYTTGILEEKEDGWYVNDRKLELYDHVTIMK